MERGLSLPHRDPSPPSESSPILGPRSEAQNRTASQRLNEILRDYNEASVRDCWACVNCSVICTGT